ncbi:uncharacterized protein Ppi1 [Drosophila bipectinata]|uniref:uncharacterized protein Ppi1 n=1 Tax=Drosophila bipectinata TaxID=42026 RepID=UPI001C89ADAF|nr:uncharacterized protein LOC108122231 [Drosophila bipectinata]
MADKAAENKAAEEAQLQMDKKPPPPKPVDEKPQINWDSYWKNGAKISYKMTKTKDEYMTCSVKKSKAEQEKSPKKPICCSGCPVKDRDNVYTPKCPSKGQKGKANKPYMNCFACNIVCQKLDMPGWEFECRDQLEIRVNVCKGCKVVLDASRINVNCLPNEMSATFSMEPECLQRQLMEGINIALVYMRKEIGRGCYFIPDAVIYRMTHNLSEIVHDGEVELTCKGCTVGFCRVRISLLMKCQNLQVAEHGWAERLAGGQDGGSSSPQTRSTIGTWSRCLDRSRSWTSAEVNDLRECGSSCRSGAPRSTFSWPSSEIADVRLCGGSTLQTQEEPCSSSASSSSLNEETLCGSCNKNIETNVDPEDAAFMEPKTSAPSCNPDFCAAQAEDGRLVDMAGPFPVRKCPKDDGFCLTFDSPPGPSAQFSADMQSPLGEGTINRLGQKVSSPILKQMHISSIKSCMLCGEDVSWMPKVAACPYCGYKAVPDFMEKPYDEEATAEKILYDHLDNQAEDFDMGSVEGCPAQKVQMENDRTSEAFEAVVRDYQLLKRSIRESSRMKACQSAVQKPINPEPVEEQKPPNLAKVFAELKSLFKAKTTEEAKNQKIQDICNEACNMARLHGKKSKSHRVAADRKQGGVAAESEKDPCSDPKPPKRRRRKPKLPYKSRYYSMYKPRERPSKPPCLPESTKIPGHMGWLWTAHPLASKPGWRPGAIRRSIRDLMSYFLVDYPVDSIPVSKYMSYYKNKNGPRTPPPEKKENLVQVPTLHIEKKNDIFTITLRPLKDAATLAKSANPYVKMKPVQFRIVKNPLMKELRDLKRCLKGIGFSKCTCHKPVMQCYCRSFVDKKRLIYHLRKECEQRKMDSCEDDLVLSETSDSEAEFEFGVTPPAGLMRPERLKSSHIKHTETQYDENDWAHPSSFPHPPTSLAQFCGCVMGERQKPHTWIYGKGVIDPPPKTPRMKNPTQKKPAKKRQAGGFVPQPIEEFLPHELSRYPGRKSRKTHYRYMGPQNYKPPDYSTDSELPLSGTHMKLLDRAAFPPTAPQRREPWARELENMLERKKIQRRTRRMVRFDNTLVPHSSDLQM